MTGFLARQAKHVVAVEGSVRRARVAATRHQHHSNVAIVACSLEHFDTRFTFDAILVVGVLEYAAMFMDGDADAPGRFLRKLRGLLSENGRLILAIENQLGLKYLAGAPEDHTGRPYFGIEDRYLSGGIRTFGRHSLGTLLKDADLGAQEWFYPFPDYKLPDLIVADRALSEAKLDVSGLVSQVLARDRYRPETAVFSTALVWQTVSRNGLIGELANSFLVSAGPARDIGTPAQLVGDLAYIFSGHRSPPYRKMGRITRGSDGELAVEKRHMTSVAPEPNRLVRQVLTNERFYQGPLYMQRLLRICLGQMPDVPTLLQGFADWIAFLRSHATGKPGLEVLPEDFLDCSPFNLIETDQGLIYFDREWVALQPLNLVYVIFRGLWMSLKRLSTVLPLGSGPLILSVVTDIMDQLDLQADIDSLIAQEAALHAAISDSAVIDTMAQLREARFQRHFGDAALIWQEPFNASLVNAYRELSASYMRDVLGSTQGLPCQGQIDVVLALRGVGSIVQGWAYDAQSKRPASSISLVQGGAVIARAPVCLLRPDVAQAFGYMDQALGFTISVPESCGDLTPENTIIIAHGHGSAGNVGVLGWT